MTRETLQVLLNRDRIMFYKYWNKQKVGELYDHMNMKRTVDEDERGKSEHLSDIALRVWQAILETWVPLGPPPRT